MPAMSSLSPGQTPPHGPQAPCDLERLDDKLGTLQALWHQHGDCYRVHSESRNADTWVINHPDWVKRVLVSNHRNYTKGIGIERVRVLLGNGLMASEGERWRRQRRMLQAAFHKRKIEAFFPVWFQQSTQLAAHWQQAAQSGVPLDVTAAVSEATLLAVLQSLFSDDFLRLQQEHGHNPFQLVSADSARDLQFAMKFRALGKLVQSVMDTRSRESRFPPDLLSHCMLARDKSSDEAMPDKLLIDEILTLIVAGHETTAAALNWVWYLLARYPEVCARVVNEARTLAMREAPAYSDLDAMIWIPRVIREALRLYPPGWLYTRRAVQEDHFGEHRIPAGSDVFICSYLLHRHPDFWEQPEAFLPERFSTQQVAARHRYAYIPFSAGPRHCIGESFAMTEMMIHLAVVAARVQPESIADVPLALETDVNLRPRDSLLLKLKVVD
ncbi:MAG TPA: cytochrome P450 [Gammaproteobacteria bacterium]|nr:cytochrome P450 [Gammaproteobacteria bacterium]